MNRIFIGSVIAVLIFILFRFRKLRKTHEITKDKITELQSKIEELNKKNIKLENHISKPLKRKTVDLATREHTIIINSDQNVTTYNFPHKLKNVRNVELISGIVPKSEYRINRYNNLFDTIEITSGFYQDIISLLMTVNQQLYDNGTGIMLAYNSVDRNVIAIATASTVMDLDTTNSIYPVIGFDKETYTFPTGTSSNNDIITASLNYFLSLKLSAVAGNRAINNLPANIYTFTDQFNTPPSTAITIDPAWEYLYSPNRVNMKHQLYVDINIDQVTYWDGTHRLARIYIPEDKEETEYESYGKPILRSINQEYIDLDKLTFRLNSVVSDENTHPYDLNGLSYSLQVQITTVDPYILHRNVLTEANTPLV